MGAGDASSRACRRTALFQSRAQDAAGRNRPRAAERRRFAGDCDRADLAVHRQNAGPRQRRPRLCRQSHSHSVSRESIIMAEEGTPITDIDSSMKAWGMPMGPFELLDEIGLDIAAHVLKSLGGARSRLQSPVIERTMTNKWLGKKTGRGFYIYPTTSAPWTPDFERAVRLRLLPPPWPAPYTYEFDSRFPAGWRLVGGRKSASSWYPWWIATGSCSGARVRLARRSRPEQAAPRGPWSRHFAPPFFPGSKRSQWRPACGAGVSWWLFWVCGLCLGGGCRGLFRTSFLRSRLLRIRRSRARLRGGVLRRSLRRTRG